MGQSFRRWRGAEKKGECSAQDRVRTVKMSKILHPLEKMRKKDNIPPEVNFRAVLVFVFPETRVGAHNENRGGFGHRHRRDIFI